MNGKVRSYCIWITAILLCALGLVMVYSASAASCMQDPDCGYDPAFLFKRQLIFILLGFVVCFVVQFIPISIFQKFAKWIYLLGIGCILLLLTSLGSSAKGATRWLNIAGIQFQVAEVVKISTIIFGAYLVSHFAKKLYKTQLIFIMWLLNGGVALLLMFISNDLSSSVVVLGITFAISYIYTKNWKLHLGIFGAASVAVGAYVLSIWNNMPSPEEIKNIPFRIARIAAWLDPERYAKTVGYQTLQSLYAVGRGGFWGQGLGNSIQKVSAIPESQNDMIFSVLCEELGIVGAGILLGLMVYLLWHVYQAAIHADSLFCSAICTGVFMHFGLQTIINVAVNVNCFPNTGIGLPFISYGGTAVFCQLAEVALVLSVVWHSKDKDEIVNKNERQGRK